MTPTAGDCRIKNLSLRASEDWREYLDRLARARRHPTWGALIDALVRAAGVDAGLGHSHAMKADLRGANLAGCNFADANFQETYLSGTNRLEANWSGTLLHGAQL